MKISIVTACYNRETTIRDSIKSVLDQDYRNIEYVIVDGASSDKSLESILSQIREYGFEIKDLSFGKRKYFESCQDQQPQIKILSEPDSGMYEAINKGIRMATGDVIGLCHSDDVLYSNNCLSQVAQRINVSNADLLYANGIYIDNKLNERIVRRWISGNYSLWKVRHGWLPLHPTCFIRKKLYDELGLYDEQFKIAADTDLLLRFLIRDDINITYLNVFLTKMQMGGLSTNLLNVVKMWREDIKVYRKNGFTHVYFLKLQKMMQKFPQFIMAKLKKN